MNQTKEESWTERYDRARQMNFLHLSLGQELVLSPGNAMDLYPEQITLERCTITGASDASIRDVVPNDIAGLLAKAPIEAVFCNGATAYRIYTKYLLPVSGIPAVKLPSTSPANAACRPETLREVWGEALKDYITVSNL